MLGKNLSTPTKRRTILVRTFITAIDFRARLRFPRVAREPPRRVRSCGVSHGQLQGIEAQHKPNRPRRQRAPSRPIRLMPPASEQSPSAFLISYSSRRSLRLALQSTAGTSSIIKHVLTKPNKKIRTDSNSN
jgi:hypothetical protein